MLAARFHALRDRTVAATDKTFAEPVRLSFLKGGAVRPGSAGARQSRLCCASAAARKPMSAAATRRPGARASQAQRGELHIDRTVYPDLKFSKGDKVRALARPGQPWFEVLTVDDRLSTRLVVQLG